MTQSKYNLFGFKIKRQEEEQDKIVQQSFTPETNEDGALTISSAAYYGTYVDLDGTAKNEVELITRYREMSMQPEIESAIDDIVNEAITQDDDGKNINLIMDNLKVSPKVKKAIQEEFNTIKRLLNYNNMASDIFRRYYIDGRLFYHIIIDVSNPQNGIKELRYVDPRKIRKIREIVKAKDSSTGIDLVQTSNEYYVFNDKVVSGTSSNYGPVGVKVAVDSIVNVNSGLMDSRRAVVLSYLHKAIKPLNQLRMIEDATVIYRISRAPERRIFYIDVSNLPKPKAEQYLRDIMVKYKNKLVYDANTGEVRDDRKFLSMMEDFWIPRRDNNKGTEITTLPGGENLGEISDIEYFEKKLYKCLNVPVSRLDPTQAQGFLGRPEEVTRDELKFSKFIDKIRNKFSELFDQALRVQCVLKGICTEEEFSEFKENMYYDFIKDNNYAEIRDAEVLQNRLNALSMIDPYVGKYYSMAWVKRNILKLSDEEIEQMQEEIEAEQKIADQDQQQQIGISPETGEGEQENQPQISGSETNQGTDISPQESQTEKGENINPYNPYKTI